MNNVDSIARNIFDSVNDNSPNPPLLVVTGPRGCGKTHLAQTLFPSYRRTALSLPSEAARAYLDPAAFLAGLPPPVVIDDAQLAPRLLHHLAGALERRPCPPAGYVLVGSRPGTLAATAAAAFQRLLRGGFPALYAAPASDPVAFMRSFIADHLARELAVQLRVDSLHDFERFLRGVAVRSGQVVNKAALAREVGIAGSTAAIWLETLVDAGLVTLVQPWRPPQGRPLVKSPKLFMLDTGLCCHLLGICTADELASSPHVAAVWETCVHAELRHLTASAGGEIVFWRDRTKEADFLVPTPRGLVIIDTAWTEMPPAAAVGRLMRIRKAIGEETVAGVAIVCRTPDRQSLREPAGPLVETVGLADLPGLLTL
jgi:predicted AAA+ superfamily ATPase